ncbi:hypothetical protein [Bacillus licheniformis]|uniref:hypothetical protein n=1 Tax=Bacillus licheniformis TaxID=1402 RepID=UPI000B8AD440|nr:hypothetical protein [Bacillus licheniformis]MED0689961.1 hypothetical protein [Bacillus licheniformis]MED0713581.1 hypothetical protein [Bacillus licheniformis]MED0789302.1 hypothetical protein [Bacillus licheniformis]TWM10448.1 hypothetical protein CHCC15091_0945 [Bacillus licheniformis]WIW99385.1 hypothetical protein QQ984_03635 [Bacillus licheniformis]
MNQVYFDDLGAFDDWGIYLSSFSIGDAPVKENFIDIPSGDGALDLTEALRGEVSYGNRPFEARFTIKPPRSAWPSLLDEIRAFLNGRKRKIRVKDVPGYYLIGRCSTSFEIDGVLGILKVSATCEPWKYKNSPTVHNLTIGASGVLDVNLTNSRKRVIPTITNSAEINIKFGSISRTVSAGTHRLTNIILTEGDNQMTISGASGTTVNIEYQEGAL